MYWLAGLAVLGAIILGMWLLSGLMSMFSDTRPVRDTDYVHGVEEKTVSPEQMGVGGSVTIAEPGELVIVDVGSQNRKLLLKCRGDWRTWGAAGPNGRGLVAFTLNDMMAKKHRLYVQEVDTGKNRLLFERPGDALWEHAIAKSMAVAEDADVALILVGKGNLQLHNPEAYMTVCDLETIDLTTGQAKRYKVDALESDVAISPNGRYLYFVSTADRKLAAWLRAPHGERPPSETDDLTPVVCRLDTRTSKVDELYPGWNVVAGPRESTLAITDYDRQTVVFDLTTARATPLTPPAYMSGMMGFARNGAVICSAKQIRNEDVQLTRHNGLPGPRPMPRIVAYDPKTNRVSVLVKAFDFRSRASYSPWPRSTNATSPIQE